MKVRVLKQTFSLAICGVLLALLSFNAFAANYGNGVLEVYALDTVAGYATQLRTSAIAPNSSVIFQVVMPNGKAVSLFSITDSEGVATAELSDSYTKTAGKYYVIADSQSYSSLKQGKYFAVYPGVTSKSVSTVSPANQTFQAGKGKAQISVKLMDAYQNPISGHKVKLISNLSGDEVFTASDLSGLDGIVQFQVSSNNSGLVTYTAYDLSTDSVLDSRAKVAYFDSNQNLFSNDPDVYLSSVDGTPGAVDHLTFENLPGTITVNSEVSPTISAYDSANQKVVSYLGNVRFSVTTGDSQYVTIPADYTFTAADQGSHTFSLSFLFKQAGTYKVEVRDLQNTAIYGEHEFVATAGSGNLGSTITITSPIAGTYSNNIQAITGTATAGSSLNILDSSVKIGTATADVNGAFTFTTPALTEGAHKFSVVSVNEVGTILASSPEVAINIDISSPEIESVVVEPSEIVDPGVQVTVRISVTKELSTCSLLLNNYVFNMTKNISGLYETTFTAPTDAGSYPIVFKLMDQLGNQSDIDSGKVLTVGTVENPVGTVTGLTATPANKKVILEWEALESRNPIKNYRVYYGNAPDNLSDAVDTFTNGTTWYIPHLTNGTKYYFAVIAIDNQDNHSEYFSTVVAATPNGVVDDTEEPDVANGTAGSENIGGMPGDSSETGPEMLWLVLASAISGIAYGQTYKRRKSLQNKSSK